MPPSDPPEASETSKNYYTLESPHRLKELLGADLDRLSLLYFRAEWVELCKTADPFIRSLAEKWGQVLFLEIEAESLPEVSDSFEVASVPCFLILRGHKLLSRTVGAKLLEVESLVEKFTKPGQNGLSTDRTGAPSSALAGALPNLASDNNGAPAKEETEEEIFARCKTLMNQSKVVLFMKGTPQVPRCGFSQKTVQILRSLDIEFTTFNILSDENVRQGMKKLNAWPTFPQLIIKGELVGGLDILQEMIQKHGDEKSELEELLED